MCLIEYTKAARLRQPDYSQRDFFATLTKLHANRRDPLLGMFAGQEFFRLLGLVPGIDLKAALDEVL